MRQLPDVQLACKIELAMTTVNVLLPPSSSTFTAPLAAKYSGIVSHILVLHLSPCD